MGVGVAEVVEDWVWAEAGSEPEVSWPLSPGESRGATLELALEELGFVVEAETPAVEDSVLEAEVVPAGVPLEEEVIVALVLPGPVGEVAIPV